MNDLLQRASSAWLSGDDSSAERLLLEERRRVLRDGNTDGIASVELELGRLSLAQLDEPRALAHLEAAESAGALSARPSIRLVALALRLSLARRGAVEAPGLEVIEASLSSSTEGALRGEVLVEAAALARVSGRAGEARSLAARALAEAPASSRALALALAEQAEQEIAEGQLIEAGEKLRQAIAAFSASGAKRDEGRALLRYGEAVAAAVPDEEPAAVWLGRAAAALGASAMYGDRAALRAAFRRHGRRLRDQALAEGIASLVDVLERTGARLRGEVARAASDAEREVLTAEREAPSPSPRLGQAAQVMSELPGQVLERLREAQQVTGELVELMSEALVERNRMRALVEALSQLDGLGSVGRYAAEAARVAAQVLDADRVVLVGAEGGALVEVGAYSARGVPALRAHWISAVERALGAPPRPSDPPGGDVLRKESRPRGPVLVVPLRNGALTGALYADKLARSGQFRDTDHHLAQLLGEYVAQGFGQTSAREAERLALAQLEATMDAIREGVLAIDGEGVVRSRNAPAAKLLRVPAEALLGRRLRDFAHLEPLDLLLRGAKRADGSVVRLGHGSLVVTARPLEAVEQSARGLVVTLLELDRAEKLAMRIAGSRTRYTFADVIGGSPSVLEALRLARQAASVDASVLVTGESGTGKEVFAQAIHTGGPRANEPFVGINCAALPRDLLEAELFGHERGAFTGARSEGAMGKFEQAGDGTLLLDEIGDMPIDMQVKLLRVLQERVVVRLGGSQERPMRARIIATTHRNLDEAVEKGTFRLDLLYRLRVLHIHLPPLRSRPEDVEAIAGAMLGRIAESQRKRVRSLGPYVLAQLRSYPWPGNIRELSNVMEREVSLLPADASVLAAFQVPLGSGSGPQSWGAEPPTAPTSVRLRAVAPASVPPSSSPNPSIVPLAEVERRAYLDAYAACSQSVSRAAKALGVSKVTFYAKLRQWGMHPADEGSSPDSVRIPVAPKMPPPEDGSG